MSEEIFKVTPNIIRATALLKMAKDRLEDISKETKTYKIIEQYYEVIKELITAIMYTDGFKTLSHKSLIYYIQQNYKEFTKEETILADELRKLRNNIVYYGQTIDKSFLINKEKLIIQIINKLIKLVDTKTK